MTIFDDDGDGITELEKFGPDRIDGVRGPANGSPFLMLKALAGPGTEPDDTTEAAVTAPVTEKPDTAQAPEDAAKPAAPEAGQSGGIHMNMSPRDFAQLMTFGRELAVEQGAAKAQAEKRDFDANVGGGVDRDKLKGGDFVFPDERDFPVVIPGDVTDAVSSWGQYKGKHTFAQFKTALTALCERKGAKFTAELPKKWDDDSDAKKASGETPQGDNVDTDEPGAGEDREDEVAAKAVKPKGGEGKKPFPGAAAPFKSKTEKDADADDDDPDGDGQDADAGDGDDDTAKASRGTGDGDGSPECPSCGEKTAKKAAFCHKCGASMKDTAEKAAKGPRCGECGCKCMKGAGFCHKCGAAVGAAAKTKNSTAEPQDAKVDSAIAALEEDADAALSAQAADPDNSTHPADAKVDEALRHVKDDVDTAAAAQHLDEQTDNPAEHKSGAKKSAVAEDVPYHLGRLHDATCAAFGHDDVVLRHPAVAKGLATLIDPDVFAKMNAAAISEERAADLPAIGAAFHAALSAKALAAGELDAAAADMRKAFADAYPDAHPKPGDITPGQFKRPYLSAGHATQSAKPGQEPRVPLASHVPSPDQFQRGLITSGREAASPGSAVKDAGGRTYYTNQARDQAKGVLGEMHDYIAGQHPDLCPMSGSTYDGENAVPGSAGSSVTTAAPVPEKFAATKDTATPQPVSAVAQAAVVTPNVTKAERKAAKRAAEAARKEAEAMTQATETTPGAAAPAIDRELLKSVLSEILDERDGNLTKTIGDLAERVAGIESSPDPAQQAPRSGAASITKARGSGPEVPAGGDGGRETERLVRLVKKAQDPDSGVRTAAIGELIETAGREAAVQLLTGI